MSQETQKLLNLSGDIEKLTKQKVVMQEMVEKLAKQHDELVGKRRDASLEYERLMSFIMEETKKHSDLKNSLEKKIIELGNREAKLSDSEVAISEERANLASDKKTYEALNSGAFEKANELSQKERDLAARSKVLEEREEHFASLSKKLSEDAEALQTRLTAEVSEATSEKVLAKLAKEEAEKTVAEHKKKISEVEDRVSKMQEKLDVQQHVFDVEKKVQDEALRKRELELVRKEKDLNDQLLIVKTRLENIELQAARK
jgi:hypothetical protein